MSCDSFGMTQQTQATQPIVTGPPRIDGSREMLNAEGVNSTGDMIVPSKSFNLKLQGEVGDDGDIFRGSHPSLYHDGGEPKRPKLAPSEVTCDEDAGDDFHKGVEIGGCLAGAGELVPYPETQALTQQMYRREWALTQFQTQSPCKTVQDDQDQSLVDEYAEHLEPLIPLSPELKPGVVRGDLKFTTSNFETSLAGSSGPDSQEIPRQPQIVFAYPEAGDGESQEGSPTRPETTEFPQTVVSKTAHLRQKVSQSSSKSEDSPNYTDSQAPTQIIERDTDKEEDASSEPSTVDSDAAVGPEMKKGNRSVDDIFGEDPSFTLDSTQQKEVEHCSQRSDDLFGENEEFKAIIADYSSSASTSSNYSSPSPIGVDYRKCPSFPPKQEVHLENQPVNKEVKSQLPNSSPSPSKTTQTNSQPSRETLQVDEEEDTLGPVALTFNDRSDLKEKLRSKNLIPHATQAPIAGEPAFIIEASTQVIRDLEESSRTPKQCQKTKARGSDLAVVIEGDMQDKLAKEELEKLKMPQNVSSSSSKRLLPDEEIESEPGSRKTKARGGDLAVVIEGGSQNKVMKKELEKFKMPQHVSTSSSKKRLPDEEFESELGPENGRNLKGRMVFEPHRQPLTQDGQPPNTTSNRQKEEEESEIPVNNFTGMPMMPLNHTTPRLGLSRSKAKVVKRIYPDGPYHWPSEGEKEE